MEIFNVFVVLGALLLLVFCVLFCIDPPSSSNDNDLLALGIIATNPILLTIPLLVLSQNRNDEIIEVVIE